MSSSTFSRSEPVISVQSRLPLKEVPLRNFIERPPSPVKSYSSPSKTHNTLHVSPNITRRSPMRTKSMPVETVSSNQLLKGALRNGDRSRLSRENSPIRETSRSRQKATATAPSLPTGTAMPVSSKKASSSTLTIMPPLEDASGATSPSATVSCAVPQSLGRKKDRVRRQLLDEDEEGSAADIRAGSPSPRKMKMQRENALRGSALSNLNSYVPTLPSSTLQAIKGDLAIWTVWQDSQEEVAASLTEADTANMAHLAGPPGHDKENAAPGNSNIRKKGTGGRLSLLATAEESDGEASSPSDVHGKRRKVSGLSDAS